MSKQSLQGRSLRPCQSTIRPRNPSPLRPCFPKPSAIASRRSRSATPECAPCLVLRAADAKDAAEANPELAKAADLLAAQAKLFCSNAAWDAADRAVQVFGGRGRPPPHGRPRLPNLRRHRRNSEVEDRVGVARRRVRSVQVRPLHSFLTRRAFRVELNSRRSGRLGRPHGGTNGPRRIASQGPGRRLHPQPDHFQGPARQLTPQAFGRADSRFPAIRGIASTRPHHRSAARTAGCVRARPRRRKRGGAQPCRINRFGPAFGCGPSELRAI